jgi:hypothetical protein
MGWAVAHAEPDGQAPELSHEWPEGLALAGRFDTDDAVVVLATGADITIEPVVLARGRRFGRALENDPGPETRFAALELEVREAGVLVGAPVQPDAFGYGGHRQIAQ